MSKTFTTSKDGRNEYRFWLTFSGDGQVTLTRGEPRVDRNQRAVAMTATLPVSLFKTPSLRASLTINHRQDDAIDFDVQAASDALSLALGVDVDMRVISND